MPLSRQQGRACFSGAGLVEPLKVAHRPREYRSWDTGRKAEKLVASEGRISMCFYPLYLPSGQVLGHALRWHGHSFNGSGKLACSLPPASPSLWPESCGTGVWPHGKRPSHLRLLNATISSLLPVWQLGMVCGHPRSILGPGEQPGSLSGCTSLDEG